MEPSDPRRDSVSAWLRLAKPIPASLGADQVEVLDLGPYGAMLSGPCTVEAGSEADLTFGDVTVRCLITGVADHTGGEDKDLLVRFVGESESLASFIAGYRAQIERAAAANLDGDVAHNVIDGDRMLSDLGAAARESDEFLLCRFNGRRWTRELTTSREQPHDGFTISAGETEDQIALLQMAYEESPESERRLLRDFAAESLSPGR